MGTSIQHAIRGHDVTVDTVAMKYMVELHERSFYLIVEKEKDDLDQYCQRD